MYIFFNWEVVNKFNWKNTHTYSSIVHVDLSKLIYLNSVLTFSTTKQDNNGIYHMEFCKDKWVTSDTAFICDAWYIVCFK